MTTVVQTRLVRTAFALSAALLVATSFVATKGATGQRGGYTGPFGGSSCAPGIVFTAWSMNWNLQYIENSNFSNLGGCVVPDLSSLLGMWELTRQEIQPLGVSNVAGKTLNIVPTAQFLVDSTQRGVTVIEEYQTEKFCKNEAATSATCAAAQPANLSPTLPAAALPIAPCRDAAVFRGAVRSDIYIEVGGGASASQPVGPFRFRTGFRQDLMPVSIRCPGAQVDVTCRNCPSFSIGKRLFVLTLEAAGATLVAQTDDPGPRVTERFKRMTTLTLGQVFNPDGSVIK
jgi:hypothetical protein